MVNKTLILVAAVLSLLWPQMAGASVTGVCSSCHVMHYSQAGTVPSKLFALGAGPQDHLLNDTCLGCHTGANSAGGKTPFVLTTGKTDLSGALAGGNFLFSGSDIHYGHNPVELGVASIVSPPGWVESGFAVNGQVGDDANWISQLTCAGVWGCHGAHTASGVLGSHHNNPTGKLDTASTSGNSYRFLYKIKGFEDSDWQYTKSATDHNVYSGMNRTSDTPESTTTISYLCAECHGIFHSGAVNQGIASAGATFFTDPWIRHPVDISMPLTGEYATYNTTNTYSTDAPLASTSVPAASSSSVAAAGERIVMCLSCHQAHATPYYAMLRWDYRGSGAGWTNGCAICHTSKS